MHPFQFVFYPSYILNQHVISCNQYFHFLGRTVLLKSFLWYGSLNPFILLGDQIFQFLSARENLREHQLIRIIFVVKFQTRTIIFHADCCHNRTITQTLLDTLKLDSCYWFVLLIVTFFHCRRNVSGWKLVNWSPVTIIHVSFGNLDFKMEFNWRKLIKLAAINQLA